MMSTLEKTRSFRTTRATRRKRTGRRGKKGNERDAVHRPARNFPDDVLRVFLLGGIADHHTRETTFHSREEEEEEDVETLIDPCRARQRRFQAGKQRTRATEKNKSQRRCKGAAEGGWSWTRARNATLSAAGGGERGSSARGGAADRLVKISENRF
mmetsp:Transcript_25666/g.47887  ORF Transcript_25666/g.47887 Transcript_25666/m.47887 type:complete len:156 (+) Transcript_25666:346-813(+)